MLVYIYLYADASGATTIILNWIDEYIFTYRGNIRAKYGWPFLRFQSLKIGTVIAKSNYNNITITKQWKLC